MICDLATFFLAILPCVHTSSSACQGSIRADVAKQRSSPSPRPSGMIHPASIRLASCRSQVPSFHMRPLDITRRDTHTQADDSVNLVICEQFHSSSPLSVVFPRCAAIETSPVLKCEMFFSPEILVTFRNPIAKSALYDVQRQQERAGCVTALCLSLNVQQQLRLRTRAELPFL